MQLGSDKMSLFLQTEILFPEEKMVCFSVFATAQFSVNVLFGQFAIAVILLE